MLTKNLQTNQVIAKLAFCHRRQRGKLGRRDTTGSLTMDRSGTIRIQAEAAKALAGWKAFFAEQVAV